MEVFQKAPIQLIVLCGDVPHLVDRKDLHGDAERCLMEVSRSQQGGASSVRATLLWVADPRWRTLEAGVLRRMGWGHGQWLPFKQDPDVETWIVAWSAADRDMPPEFRWMRAIQTAIEQAPRQASPIQDRVRLGVINPRGSLVDGHVLSRYPGLRYRAVPGAEGREAYRLADYALATELMMAGDVKDTAAPL